MKEIEDLLYKLEQFEVDEINFGAYIFGLNDDIEDMISIVHIVYNCLNREEAISKLILMLEQLIDDYSCNNCEYNYLCESLRKCNLNDDCELCGNVEHIEYCHRCGWCESCNECHNECNKYETYCSRCENSEECRYCNECDKEFKLR